MITAKEKELLAMLIDAERRYWLAVAKACREGKIDADGFTTGVEWNIRGVEVGVDLSAKEKRPYMEAAHKLVAAGIAEWSEGAVANNYLRLACCDLNRLETHNPDAEYRFRNRWNDLAKIGKCDSIDGHEYERKYSAWRSAGYPHDEMDTYITR